MVNDCFSQLYRSSSFNSSGCGSGGEPADDMYSDVSLEEDVQGLNYKVSGYVHCYMIVLESLTLIILDIYLRTS